MVQRKTEALQAGYNAVRLGRLQHLHQAGIHDVDGDADGHRFAMLELEVGHLLEHVRGPVAKIQRSRFSQLKRIVASHDVPSVEFR